MLDPFLIDECLSPDLVAEAHARGHYATHVVHRGLAGTADPDLMPIILGEDFVFVTNNRKDFVRLYEQAEVHPGLIVILPGGILAEEQKALFDKVLDFIEPLSDLVNKLVEVDKDGIVKISSIPSGNGFVPPISRPCD
jgi:predicted nuclease of predicted toxin-antitoxin system